MKPQQSTSASALLREVAVREHRALRAAGGARRVEDRREVVGLRVDGGEVVGLAVGALEQRPRPAASVSTVASGRSAATRSADSGWQTMTARLRVAEEVGELAFLVARIERQVHEPGAQAREIQRERLPALVDLGRDAVAGLATGRDQRVRDARRRGVEIVVVDDRTVRDQQAGLLGALGEMGAQQRVEIGVHAGPCRARVGARREGDITANFDAPHPLLGASRPRWPPRRRRATPSPPPCRA